MIYSNNFNKQNMNNFNHNKIKKIQITPETINIYQNPKAKHRILNDVNNRKPDQEQLKNATRKSIDITTSQQPNKHSLINTIYQAQNQKSFYKRVSHNFKKNTVPQRQRYEQQERDNNLTRLSSKSPYVRISSKNQKQLQVKANFLNKSTNKIKSNQLLKQNSPRYFYKQPRSSLSQHYDPSIEASLHKRKVSAVGEEKYTLLDEAKELYKNNNYSKSIQLLKKFVRLNKNSVQGHYLLGMSFININEFNLGIDQLTYSLQLEPTYKKSLYLVIALSYKKLHKFDQAIQILNKGIELYPDYYDCLVYRGKLHLKKDNHFHALKDFTEAIKINSSKGFAYIGKGSCEKQLGHYDSAIQTFTLGINTDMSHICYEKRGIIYYQQNKYQQALKDFQHSCSIDSNQSSTSHYYKGLIYYKQQKITQAILCFQQSLKCDSHKQNVTSSVQMMMRIKIQQKDFYEAYHILTRSDNLQVDTDILNQWRLFLEASLFLMKKKYTQGINTFISLLTLPTYKTKYSLIKNKVTKERYAFMKPLIHLYKAFGQLCENKPGNAEKEYVLYQELCRQLGAEDNNLSKNYNKLIMNAYKLFPQSRQYLEDSIKLIPNKPEPYLYLSFNIIRSKFQKEENLISKNNCIQQAIDNISTGISHLPQLSNNHISTFYYFRAILYLYQNDFNKSVADIDKAIQKSQDNIPKYFHLRGLIFAVFGNFSQAIQDLTVAINLDEKLSKSYLQRAKCLQIEGNSNEAFLDLQKYITLAPEDQQIHKYAGYLLFQNCAYEDCLSAFSHGADIQNDAQLTLTKAKCHFLLGQQVSIKLFKRYSELSYNNQYQSDVQVIQICRSIKSQSTDQNYLEYLEKINQILSMKKEQDCKIFKLRDMHQIKASIYLILGQYYKAIDSFQTTLKLFNIQKNKEMEKHFIEDTEQFQDQWSEVEIKFNLSICFLCLKDYESARDMLLEFDKSSQKGKNWSVYMNLINDLIHNSLNKKKGQKYQLDTFQQNHRISKNWPKIKLPELDVYLSMAFSYPFVEPPELMPQFNHDLFQEFDISKSQNKPEAPWINRSQGGLVFTPNIQIYENLQLSMTTTKKNDSIKNKPVSDMQKSIDMSNSQFQLQSEDLKKKFKLDSMVEMKLKRLMDKKQR